MVAGIYPDKKEPDREPTTNITERRSVMSERITWEEQEERIEESVRLQDDAYRQYAELLASFRCMICGESGAPRRLWDGRETALCADHTNAWHEYITARPLWLDWVEMEARYDVAVHSCAERVAVDIKRRAVKLRAKGYELSGKWLEGERMRWQER